MSDIEIPKKLPISGYKGAEYLERIKRRAQHLRTRIIAARPKENHWDSSELSAIEWAIKNIVLYEKLLKGENVE